MLHRAQVEYAPPSSAVPKLRRFSPFSSGGDCPYKPALAQVRSTLEFSTRRYRYIRNMLSRRGLMVLWSACVMASADDTACALQKALGKPKTRDNYAYFWLYDPMCTYSPSPVQSVQFHETSHSITQGQPYEGVFTLGYYLDVRAGRHGSEEVARDFNAGISPDNALGLATFTGDTPYHQSSTLRFSVICL